MKSIVINTKIIEVSPRLGTILANAVEETVAFCKEHKVEARLTFNDKAHVLNSSTDVAKAVADWWKK